MSIASFLTLAVPAAMTKAIHHPDPVRWTDATRARCSRLLPLGDYLTYSDPRHTAPRAAALAHGLAALALTADGGVTCFGLHWCAQPPCLSCEGTPRRILVASRSVEDLARQYALDLGHDRNARKGTAAYYTPRSLVDLTLDEALDPVLDQAGAGLHGEDLAAALLGQTFCDPSCGSGAFLVPGMERIAHRVAVALAGTPHPTLTQERMARHAVATSCVYGVDLDPVAVELARAAVWMSATVPGWCTPWVEPHIKVGNSLLGTTPALLAKGIPDAAFTPLTGDDPKYARMLRRRNAGERDQVDLFLDLDLEAS